MIPVPPQLPKLKEGTLRNYHRMIEDAAQADPELAALLPEVLERHRKLQEGLPGKLIFVSRISFTLDMLPVLGSR